MADADAAQAVFARTPALLNEDGLIDYGTAEGIAIYKDGSQTLMSDKKTKLDLTTIDKKKLIKKLVNKAIINGWNGIFQVPVDNEDPDGETLSFLDHPHVFDMEHLQDYAMNHVDSEDRNDQNNTMIYNSLRATFSDKALDKVDKRTEEFFINGVPSALCFLKVIIQASCLDTNKSATAARKTLMKLDELIVNDVVDFNISDFVEEVSNLLEVLGAFNQTYNEQDLILNSIDALRQVTDDRFQRWVDRKEDDVNDGTLQESEDLLKAAKTEYESRMLDGNWCKPCAKDEQIMALETKVEGLSLQLKKKGGKGGGKPQKEQEGKPTRRVREFDSLPAPKDGEPHTQMFKLKSGKTKEIHWCPKHVRWVVHLPSKCELRGVINAQETQVEAPTTIEGRAALAIQEAEDTDSDGEPFV